MEAEHYFTSSVAPKTAWTVIPHMGRTLSGVALMPYTQSAEGASLSYKMKIPQKVDTVNVYVIVKSTLPFLRREGHRYTVGFEGGEEQTVCFNAELNEHPDNVYRVLYPTVARRVVKTRVKLSLPDRADGTYTLVLKPVEPAIVFEKIVVDYGGYEDSYLFMDESPCRRNKLNGQ